jgi:poly-gamma-glutamate capsule biosynthesis protein CapA/YwtB (metallophosphatase superfamily)
MNESNEQCAGAVTLFLCGDVMTGRGVDQILRHPSRHELLEPYVRDAREYVQLAEARNGRIPGPVVDSYIWGDALMELDRVRPAARIINVETSVTTSSEYWRGKEIHYRMHPKNIGIFLDARIDVCVLANNHVLDFGYPGLLETLDALGKAGLKIAGAGRDLTQAQAPAVIPLKDRNVIVFALGSQTSGIFPSWAATDDKPGVHLLGDLSEKTATSVAERVLRVRRQHDIVVASIHWGSNWGYDVPRDQVRFAHWLIDGGVDVVHGHSSHHPRPLEVYRNRLILYGCGDFLNDYEGIHGYEQYRGDLALMYFPSFSATTGELTSLVMAPMQIRKIRLTRISGPDAAWMRTTLDRISATYGSRVNLTAEGTLQLRR